MSLPSFSLAISNGLFLAFIAGIPLYAALKKVKVYESFVDGAKESFNLTVKIIPYLVGMIVAIGMFRASGGFDLLGKCLAPILSAIDMPPQVIPLAIMRPFSGSAANGILAELIHNYGGNSYIAKVAATMIGSTENTFYVIAIYFGVVAIRRTRYAIPAGLIADTVGILASVLVCHFVFK